jgi:hypothetical protein
MITCACEKPSWKQEGVWTIAGIACHYVTCERCACTKADAPDDLVEGRKVALYEDLGTSEITGESDSFNEILFAHEPINVGARLVRNGIVLAEAICAVGGVIAWRVSRWQEER